MNRQIRTVIIALMTTARQEYPTRINTLFQGKKGQIVLDQIRTVDKRRLVKVLGRIDEPTADRVLETLAEMFAP
jgi:mRNA interferase MazF